MVHRARQGFVEQRTATINRIRGLLSELGIVLPLKASTVRSQAAAHLEDLPGWANTVIGDLLSEVSRLDERVQAYDRHVAEMAKQDHKAQQLMRLRGIGQTAATALVAMIGNGHDFDSGRQLSAWIGLVPGQYSSGGKTRLGRITKSGDAYVRPHARGLGAGALLMQAAIAAASARPEVQFLRLTLTEGNEPAQRLYESVGFLPWGVEPHAIRTPSGFKGKVHMSLRLARAETAA